MTRASDRPAVEQTRISGLDGLRGVAAIVVLLHHIELVAGHRTYFRRGFLAVDLFFMLSGFVIGLVYERRLVSGWRLTDYAKVRFVRLYPLIALGIVLGFMEVIAGLYRVRNPTLMLVAQLLFIPVLWRPGAAYPLAGVQWSLFFEAFINAAHAVIAPWLTTARLSAIVACSAVALIVAGHHHRELWVGFDQATFAYGFINVTFCFFAGLLLFRVRAKHVSVNLPWPVLAGMFVSAILVIDVLPQHWTTEAAAILFIWPALIWLGAHSTPTPQMAKLCTWLGAISYPLYATQDAVRALFSHALVPSHASVPTRVLLYGLCIVLSIVVALVADRFFDVPVRRFLLFRLRPGRPKQVLHAEP